MPQWWVHSPTPLISKITDPLTLRFDPLLSTAACATSPVFVGLLEAREMTFQDEASLERAVHRYRGVNIDFADCLHVATAETFDQLPLASLEKKARSIDGFEALRG